NHGKIVEKDLSCPYCNAIFEKRNLEKVLISQFDYIVNEIVKIPKIIPVRINYTYKGKRYNKKPDWYDYEVIEYFKNHPEYSVVKKAKFPYGEKTSEPIRNGLKYFHQTYTNKTLRLLDQFLMLSDGTNKEIEAQFLLGSTIS